MSRYIMVVDTTRCTGCHTCAFACKLENNLPDKVWWNHVGTGIIDENKPIKGDTRFAFKECVIQENGNLKFDITQVSQQYKDSGIPLGVVNSSPSENVAMQYITKACQHCEDPACIKSCPTDAIYKTKDGIVDVILKDCIGCDECRKACPYDVRHLIKQGDTTFLDGSNTEFGKDTIGYNGRHQNKVETVNKCTFCHHRIKYKSEEELENYIYTTACVDACSAQARYFLHGEYNTKADVEAEFPNKTVKQLYPGGGTKPSVYFLYDAAVDLTNFHETNI